MSDAGARLRRRARPLLGAVAALALDSTAHGQTDAPPAPPSDSAAGPAAAEQAAPEADAAAPDPLEVCVAAHQVGRDARDERRLHAVRPELRECAREGCPIAVRAECDAWLAEAERQVPTIVLGASVPRGDPARVSVSMDGHPLAERLDGTPIEVEPGPHVFRFVAPGRQVVEVHAVVELGEKNRRIRAEWVDPPRPPPAAAPTPRAEPRQRWRSVPTATWLLGAAALASAGTATAFLAVGVRERDQAASECAPLCAESRVAGVRRWFILADAFGAAALAATGTAAYLYVLPEPNGQASLVVGLTGAF